MTLRLAYVRRRGSDGAQRLETQYVDVVCRGPLATRLASDVGRGARIYVDGKLDLHAWTDRSDGRSRQVHRVDAGADPANVHYLSRRPASRGRMP
jgi:single-stranded DNA-binding protein